MGGSGLLGPDLPAHDAKLRHEALGQHGRRGTTPRQCDHMPWRDWKLIELPPVRCVSKTIAAEAYRDGIEVERESVERTGKPLADRLDIGLLQSPNTKERV